MEGSWFLQTMAKAIEQSEPVEVLVPAACAAELGAVVPTSVRRAVRRMFRLSANKNAYC